MVERKGRIMHVLNLDSNFELKNWKGSKYNLKAKLFNFSGGECHIKLEGKDDYFDYSNVNEVLITHRINNSDNLMQVLLAADALKRKYGNIKLNGFFPYMPYGRQDRPMVEGEPFSLKVFANIINLAGFNKVYTLDPHSDVTPALIDNLEVIKPNYLLAAKEDILKDYGEFVLVAPDGGALKKIYNQAKLIDYKGEMFCATKHRDVTNGKITGTEIPFRLYSGETVWIMDDICDGGRTFIELAKVLKEKGAEHVVLSVSHAIISHGEEELKKYIDKIYSTNSIKDGESDLIKRFKI